MLDPQLIPVARLLRLVRLDAPDVMRRALHQLADQTAGLVSDLAARGGWPGLESLCPGGVLLAWIELADQGAEKRARFLTRLRGYEDESKATFPE